MATLTRSQMEQVIANGGSVLHGGKIITRVMDLPTDADLAVGDPNRETQIANDLQQQIDHLQAQMERLQAGKQKAAPSEPKNAPANPPANEPKKAEK